GVATLWLRALAASVVGGLSLGWHICRLFSSGALRGAPHVHSLARAGASPLLRRAVRRVRRRTRRRPAARPAVVLAPSRACCPARLALLPTAQPGVRRGGAGRPGRCQLGERVGAGFWP